MDERGRHAPGNKIEEAVVDQAKQHIVKMYLMSSILKYLRDINMSPTTTHLITYSDSCGGQNRNIYLVCLWLHIVACSYLPLTTVDQKFMLPGHSYLSNDRDFGISSLPRKRSRQFIASSPGPSQILSRSRGEKSGEGLGAKLRHHRKWWTRLLRNVDSVSQ